MDDIILSQNHPNLLIYIPDSASPLATLNFITNDVLYKGQERFPWVSNFSFYDNVVTPHTGGTIPSLVYLFGGKEFSIEKQVDALNNQQGREDIIVVDTAIKSLAKELDDNVKISYNYIEGKDLNSTNASYIYSPILAASSSPDAPITNYYSSIAYTFSNINYLVDLLNEYNIYDSTKIMVFPDHGTYTEPEKIMPKTAEFLYNNDIATGSTIPAYIMIKDFNSPNTNFSIDSRVLSGLDIYDMLVLSFTNKEGYVDYTKTQPPNRIFNVTFMWWPYLAYLAAKPSGRTHLFIKGYNTVLYKYGGKASRKDLSYIKVKSAKEALDTNIYSFPISNYGELPPFEIVN